MPSPWTPVLKAVAPNANKKFLAAFDAQADAVFAEYGMKSSTAICIMIGQMAHESSGFTRFEENLNYSATRLREVFQKYYPTAALAQAEAKNPRLIANRVYGGRMGNRPGTNDGYDNRGSGAMQHTGETEKQRVAKRAKWAPATVMAALRDPAEAALNMAGGVTLQNQINDTAAIEAIVNAAIAAYFAGLPTTMPGAPGQMWFNDGFLCRT